MVASTRRQSTGKRVTYKSSLVTPLPDTQKSGMFQLLAVYLFKNPGGLPYRYFFLLEVGHHLRLGQVRLFPAKINVIFGISTSNNAGISKIYAITGGATIPDIYRKKKIPDRETCRDY